MKHKQIKHHMDGLIALLLFGVFAVCVLIVLLTGADAYRRLTLRDQAAYGRRTCIQYIATKVRQADTAGGVTVERLGDTDALALWEDGEYVTYIYCWDGWLMELYCWAEEPMAPEDGEQVMELAGLTLALDGGLLTVTTLDSVGTETELLLSLRSGSDAPAQGDETADPPPADLDGGPSTEPAGTEDGDEPGPTEEGVSL